MQGKQYGTPNDTIESSEGAYGLYGHGATPDDRLVYQNKNQFAATLKTAVGRGYLRGPDAYKTLRAIDKCHTPATVMCDPMSNASEPVSGGYILPGSKRMPDPEDSCRIR